MIEVFESLEPSPYYRQRIDIAVLRLDMKLFNFSFESAMQCFAVFQDYFCVPIEKKCIVNCRDADGKSIRASKITDRMAANCTSSEKGESFSCGASIQARVRTDRLKLKSDISAAMRNADGGALANPRTTMECYDHFGKMIRFPCINGEIDDHILDELHRFANMDKRFLGIGNAWEIIGSLTCARDRYAKTGDIISLGDLNIEILYPCIEANINDFYEYLKHIANTVHEIVPLSYCSVELGSGYGESFDWVYSVEYSKERRNDPYRHLTEYYPFLGGYNIITDKMAEKLGNIPSDIIVSRAKYGICIETKSPFSISGLIPVRALLEPILAKSTGRHISHLFCPTLLPIPRGDFIIESPNGIPIPMIRNG